MKSLKILSTKKLSQEIHAAFHPDWDLTEADFIQITKRPLEVIKEEAAQWQPLQQEVSLVFTSRHAVIDPDTLFENSDMDRSQVFCLSGATLKAVQQTLPQTSIAGIADHASALAGKVISSGVKEVLFFCGNKRRPELPELLRQEGIEVKEIIVYETEQGSMKMDQAFDAILFFSPSAVESFFLENGVAPHTTCFAIGETTADQLKEYSVTNIIVAKQPSQQSMLETLREFAEKTKWNDNVKK